MRQSLRFSFFLKRKTESGYFFVGSVHVLLINVHSKDFIGSARKQNMRVSNGNIFVNLCSKSDKLTGYRSALCMYSNIFL